MLEGLGLSRNEMSLPMRLSKMNSGSQDIKIQQGCCGTVRFVASTIESPIKTSYILLEAGRRAVRNLNTRFSRMALLPTGKLEESLKYFAFYAEDEMLNKADEKEQGR